MDYDLWLRMSPFVRVIRVPEVLAFYRHYEGTRITRNRLRIAMNHWLIQQEFLQSHPEVMKRFGRGKVRGLTLGFLKRRAYEAYWDRDLQTARTLFGVLLRYGYAGRADLKYMLPSLLPYSVQQWIVQKRDRRMRSMA